MIVTEQKRNQIMSYIVHAGEILQKEEHFPKYLYKYAYLPAGSELYTGVIKAAGYLFLDKSLNNIVFLVNQNEYPDEIIEYTSGDEILILGRYIKNVGIKTTKTRVPIFGELFDQLLYIRLLTEVKSVTLLGIGTAVEKENVIQKTNEIGYIDFGIVILGKASEENNSKISKNEDNKMIKHILTKKTYKPQKNRLGNMYTNIIKNHKRKPELVVYIHSSDIGIKTSKQIGYICMVA